MLLPQSIAVNLKNQQSNTYFIFKNLSSQLKISLEENHQHGTVLEVMKSPVSLCFRTGQ